MDLPGPGSTAAQRRLVRSYRNYRYYEGDPVRRGDLERVFARPNPAPVPRTSPDTLTVDDIGHLLGHLGAHEDSERLPHQDLPASSGVRYATQVYLEVQEIAGLSAGVYYYHRIQHRLELIRSQAGAPGAPALRLHLIGDRGAESESKSDGSDLRERLLVESGRMIGLLERVLPQHGLGITADEDAPATVQELRGGEQGYWLGTFRIGPALEVTASVLDTVEIYVQSHAGRIVDLPPGRYHFRRGHLIHIGEEIVARHHLPADHQPVYDRASFGLTVASRGRDRRAYADLGRAMQTLVMNERRLGFTVAGHSSENGLQLPVVRRIQSILGGGAATSFLLGGRISTEQLQTAEERIERSTGPRRDDLVTAAAPAQILRPVVARTP